MQWQNPLSVFVGPMMAMFWGLRGMAWTVRGLPDYTKWSRVPVYSLWAAACLWCERNPWPTIRPDSPSYPCLQELKGAIAAGKLELLSGSGNMQSTVTRDALLKYATQTGQRPKFLFPDNVGQ